MRTRYLIALLFSCSLLSAQEICDNGIDDDGDGDIDLLDSDCICPSSTGSITADFEDNTCCPTTITFAPGTGYNCVNDEWDFASDATTDYYHDACGFLGGVNGPVCPTPIPSGDGAIAFATRQSDGYNEGIARCLDCTLIGGQDYDVSFYAGFNSGVGLLSSSPVEFALYGRANCGAIPNPGIGCLENLG